MGRDNAGAKEQMNIEILQRKWPGVFRINNRRKGVAGTEVTMNWKGYMKVGSKKETTVKVRQLRLKKPRNFGKFASSLVIKYTNKVAKSDCLNRRCSELHLKTVADAIGMKYKGTSGI